MKYISRILLSVLVLVVFNQLSMAQIVLQRCDAGINWKSENALSLDKGDAKEGRSSLKMSGSETMWFAKKFSQSNTRIDETGYLSFWLYVSDVSAFNGDGQVEIGSAGVSDQDEYNWSMASLNLSNGWNEVKLAITDAGKMGNPLLSALNHFRIYQPLSGSITAKIDFIRLTKTENPEISKGLLDIKEVDKTTLDGKVMFGYQGWFASRGDGSKLNRFNHWGPLETGSGKPAELAIDMWYDDREFDLDELYKTGYSYPDGRNAKAFSSYNKKTVFRHMKWLRDYNLDGVFLQRFLSDVQDPSYVDFRDSVLIHVMEGSERYGRAFVMMYDGIDIENGLEKIKADWKHLIDDYNMTESPAYLHHRGLPLVSLWGYVVHEALSVQHLEELIDFFHNNPEEKYRASIKIGCDQKWIDSYEWKNALKNVDVISPWSVGRYNNKATYESFANHYTNDAQEWCDNNNVDFMPVNWPGFSWYNLLDGPKNQIPRNGGQYFWDQISGNLSRGSKSLYIAMFDEVDEGTAMFKLNENASQSPDKGYWLDLDDDGLELPSDWYLRCASLATEVTKGHSNNRINVETPNDGLDVITMKVAHASCGKSNGILELGYPNTSTNPIMEFSIDGGVNYSYATTASSELITITDLTADTYNVWVRYEDDTHPTDLGDVTIFDTIPQINIKPEENSLEITIDDVHYMRSIEVSIDSGTNYNYNIADTVYRLTINDFAAPDTFQIWYRLKDIGCETIALYEKPAETTAYMEHFIPGLIQAEHYDIGGEGVAYHDADDVHTGDADFRKDESVDIGDIYAEEGGMHMGWNSDGEWVNYTISNVVGGIYDVEFRVAGPENGKYFEMSIDDEIIGKITTPNTGDYQKWEIARMKNVVLEGGEDVTIKVAHTNGVNLDYFRFVEPILPEKATAPNPADGDVDVALTTVLRWTKGDNSVSHDIYFGTTNPPEFVVNQSSTLLSRTLEPNKEYFWRVDEVSGPLVTEGDVWSFTTAKVTDIEQEIITKNLVIYPNPANEEFNVDFTIAKAANISVTLSDVSGQVIMQSYNNKDFKAGSHQLKIFVSDLNSGTYLMKIAIDNMNYTKLVLIK